MIAKIALAIPNSMPFDYLIPCDRLESLKVGIRVIVPFAHRETQGVVVDIKESSRLPSLKSIIRILDPEPVFDQWHLAFTLWIARYYLCSWGEVLEAALPKGLKAQVKISLAVDWDHPVFADLMDEEKRWLKSLEKKTKTQIQSQLTPREKKQYDSLVKEKALYFKSAFRTLDDPSLVNFIELNPRPLVNKKRRKGSKVDLILSFLNQNPLIEKKELLSEFPGARGVINELRKSGFIIEKLIDKPPTPTDGIAMDLFLKLNQEQHQAFIEIKNDIDQRRFHVSLINGITGSGKTEIYLHAVRECLLKKRTVLILLPEISLTPQTVARFKERFNDQIAVLHSGIGFKEKAGQWWNIKKGQSRIVIGARSAIFAPLNDIGLIVVDEEHDHSYKQQETPFYNARDLAVKLGSLHQAAVVLGSATPSLESFHHAQIGKYRLLELKSRANLNPLPQLKVIDLKAVPRQSGVFYLSKELIENLKLNHEANKQAIIFLNRRGYASFLSCVGCEIPVLCRNCAISLTWHQTQKRLICHHCGFNSSYPAKCAHCNGEAFRMEGIGTQRVERDLKILLPRARFLRMDRDSIRKRGTLESHIQQIHDHQVDIVIGTQLISKGHDFKDIGLVCVVLADMGLNIPDFRSSEKIFQLISQVSGRSGRGSGSSEKGSCLIQSYNPSHFAIAKAAQNDFLGFFKAELENRELFFNPPFSRQILFKTSDVNPIKAEKAAIEIKRLFEVAFSGCAYQMLGPVKAPIEKVNNRYYYHVLLKSGDIQRLKQVMLDLFFNETVKPHRFPCRVRIDVDPYNLS
ncbi:MAG: primosomal protein N' [Deltaproteobacteria bacterium]|nr:primosomal protein N' [Deltaproteobacteria bacterium]